MINIRAIRKIEENDGGSIMKKQHIHCPANGWDCPYYTDEDHPCRCTLEHPEEDCDDFWYFWGEDEDFVDDDWEV